MHAHPSSGCSWVSSSVLHAQTWSHTVKHVWRLNPVQVNEWLCNTWSCEELWRLLVPVGVSLHASALALGGVKNSNCVAWSLCCLLSMADIRDSSCLILNFISEKLSSSVACRFWNMLWSNYLTDLGVGLIWLSLFDDWGGIETVGLLFSAFEVAPVLDPICLLQQNEHEVETLKGQPGSTLWNCLILHIREMVSNKPDTAVQCCLIRSSHLCL